jgi:hypothetical protein
MGRMTLSHHPGKIREREALARARWEAVRPHVAAALLSLRSRIRVLLSRRRVCPRRFQTRCGIVHDCDRLLAARREGKNRTLFRDDERRRPFAPALHCSGLWPGV